MLISRINYDNVKIFPLKQYRPMILFHKKKMKVSHGKAALKEMDIHVILLQAFNTFFMSLYREENTQ